MKTFWEGKNLDDPDTIQHHRGCMKVLLELQIAANKQHKTIEDKLITE